MRRRPGQDTPGHVRRRPSGGRPGLRDGRAGWTHPRSHGR